MTIRDTFDGQFILKTIPNILKALPITLYISFASAFFGCLAGFIIAFLKVSKRKIIRVIVNFVTNVIRGIPTVVILYLIYFGLPMFMQNIFGINISSWQKQTFCIIALSTEFSVTCSEMFRSAYNSLDQGQLEGARALGMNKIQSFLRVILPQTVYVILPNLNNATLSIIQGTVLVYTLGIMDIIGRARMIDTNAMGLKTFECFFIVAVIYWIISILITCAFRIIEKRMGRGSQTAGTIKEGKR